jgi:hypothetical protein
MGASCSSQVLVNIQNTFTGGSACPKTSTDIINEVNNIVSISISKTVSNCFISQSAEQSIRIRCKPKLSENTTCYEENFACGQCINNIKLGQEYQNQLERNLWSSSPATVRQSIDNFYQSLLDQMNACGLTYCKACVLSNITQINVTEADAECISNSMTQTNIKSNISSLVKQQLLNNQDVLSGAAQTLGIQDLESLSEVISSNISTVVNQQFIQDLQQIIKQSQIIEILSETSIKLSNVSQTSVATVTQKFVSDQRVALNAFSQETFDSISKIAQSQNTLNDIGNVVIDSSISFVKAIDSAVGKVTLALVILLGVVVLAIIGYLIYTNVNRLVLKQTEENFEKQLNQ